MPVTILLGVALGFLAWFLVRYLVAGVYTVNQNERAVKTSFGRAERVGKATTLQDPIADALLPEEKERPSAGLPITNRRSIQAIAFDTAPRLSATRSTTGDTPYARRTLAGHSPDTRRIHTVTALLPRLA
jgi:regulator of protease activity HflC (stomatin/prohibitin superfamily)